MPRANGDEIARTIARIMEKAESALRTRRWFVAEAHAAEALRQARAANRFGEIGRILLPLQEARRQRAAEAAERGKVRVLAEAPAEGAALPPGLVLVAPPLVGADARRLRLAAIEQQVPLLVVCREPITAAKTCPIVAIGGTTIRTRIEPPRRLEAPTKAWFLAALEQLGDAAIASIATLISLQVFATAEVDGDTICGSVSIYLLIAATFAAVYSLVAAIDPGAFTTSSQLRFDDPALGPDRLLVYFSLATITTVGYGDVFPTSDITRPLSNLEAVIGQFYMTVLVARLVGQHLTRSMRSKETAD